MVIGIEASRANRAQRTGVEWYAAHLLRELHRLPVATLHAWVLYTNAPLQQDLREWTKGWTERVLSWPPKYLWTQLRLSSEMRLMPPDVLFVPAHVLPRVLPKRTVVTIHDVGFRRHPEFYKPIQVAYHEATTRDIVRSSAHILTVSEFSKQELVTLYGCPPDRVHVTPLGVQHEVYRPCSQDEQRVVREQYQLGDEPVFLFIGRFEEKKNIGGVLEAFFAFAERSPKGLLLLVGQPGKGWKRFAQRIEHHPQGKRVRVLGYVTEAQKVALLSTATALLHLSWYEGFGLTILEAFACGALVIASSAGSLPEVAGGAAFALVSPQDTQEASHALERVIDLSAQERSVYQTRGVERAKEFTWQKTAEATYAVLTDYEVS